MKFINECAAICNKYMFVEVPCLDIKFIDEPFGMFSDEHVNFFTVEGLCSLMSRAGFTPIELEMPFGIWSWQSAGCPSLVSLWKKESPPTIPVRLINSSVDCLNKYLDVSEKLWRRIDDRIKEIDREERLAVWGVGNHLHKLLAATDLVNKNIVRVYDSDRHKHSCRVCGVSVTAFDPNDISSGAVDSILITTYTAQRAIKKFIDQQNLPCKIYTLYDIP